jgi:hypothetical protein
MPDLEKKFASVWAVLAVVKNAERSFFIKREFLRKQEALFLALDGFQRAAFIAKAYGQKDPVLFWSVFVAQNGREYDAYHGFLGDAEPLIRSLLQFEVGFFDLGRALQIELLELSRAGFYSRHSEKIGLEQAQVAIQHGLMYGAILGICFPDLVYELFERQRTEQGGPDVDTLMAKGMDFSDTFVRMYSGNSNREIENDSLKLFEEFCRDYYPGVLTELH